MAEQGDDRQPGLADDVRSAAASKDRGPGDPLRISADDARGGEIILRTRRRRIIFISGLVGIVLLAILVRVAGYW